MEVFLEEVRTRAEDLETLEAIGTQFMASAKVHCTSLVYTPSHHRVPPEAADFSLSCVSCRCVVLCCLVYCVMRCTLTCLFIFFE